MVSRDVIFHERNFPYHQMNTSQLAFPIFSLPTTTSDISDMQDTSTDIFTTITRQEINTKVDYPCAPIHYPMQHNIKRHNKPTMTLHTHDTPSMTTILPNTNGKNNHVETQIPTIFYHSANTPSQYYIICEGQPNKTTSHT